MRRTKTAVGLIVTAASLVLAATPAFAEFTSHDGEAKGKDEGVSLKLEAGGGTVSCITYLAGLGKILWTLLKENKPATKGPNLRLNAESWEECKISSKELAETTAEVSKCELELPQSSNQLSVTGQLVSKCTIKAASCELKLEPKENEKLTSFALLSSGEKDLNLVVLPNVTNVTTKIAGTCPGITATSEGKLTGALEAKLVQPGDEGEYTIQASELELTPLNNASLVTVAKRAGVKNKYESVEVVQVHGLGQLTVEQPAAKLCGEKEYIVNQSCSYKVTYNGIGWVALGTAVGGPSGVFAALWIRAR